MTTIDRPTRDACILLRSRVTVTAAAPTRADGLLLHAALHLEGRCTCPPDCQRWLPCSCVCHEATF